MRETSARGRTAAGSPGRPEGGRELARRRLASLKRGGAVAAVAGFGVLAGLAAAHGPGRRHSGDAGAGGPRAARAALPERGGFFAADGLPADALAGEPPVVPAQPTPPPAPVVRSSAS